MCVYCDAPNRVDVDNDGAPVVVSNYPQWYDEGRSGAYGMIVRTDLEGEITYWVSVLDPDSSDVEVLSPPIEFCPKCGRALS